MRAALRITGPNVNREVALDRAGAELTLGRDPAVDVQLSDPQRHISRKHVAVRQVGEGVELRNVSALNGIETSRGLADPGQLATLGAGDHFILGPYRVAVVMLPGEAVPLAPMPDSGAQDPFDALLGRSASAPHSDDPFAGPEFRGPQDVPAHSGVDPFDVLAGGTGGAVGGGSAGPFGNLLGRAESVEFGARKPLAPGSVDAQFEPLPGARPLDEWLGGGAPGQPLPGPGGAGPLEAFLGRAGAPVKKALSPDHVHSINMPLQFGNSGARAAPAAAPPTPAAPGDDDMWAILQQGAGPPPASGGVVNPALRASPPNVAATPSSGVAGTSAEAGAPVGDDPFDDWADTGSQLGDAAIARPDAAPTGIVPAANAHARSAVGQAGAWPAFARGLGLPPTQAFNEPAAEQAGVMVRLVIEGLAELLGARAELKRELRAEDRTMLSGRDNNPLKAKLSAVELIQYLFAAQAGGGYMAADRAVRESIAELRVHEQATIAAARAAVEGALRDFEPGRLRKLLDKGKPGMFQVFDNARLWEAYEQHYDKRAQQMADWLEAVFTRHFMPTYSRESERLKAEGRSDPAA